MENKIKKIWVHEAYKQVGTSNWTVREQDEKPPRPTAYPNDWEGYVSLSALESANEKIAAQAAQIVELENQSDKDGLLLIKIGNEASKIEKNLTDKIASLEAEVEWRTKAAKASSEEKKSLNDMFVKSESENSELKAKVESLEAETSKLINGALEGSKALNAKDAEIASLKSVVAELQAEWQRTIDIGVNMQRKINDRVEAENKSLRDILHTVSCCGNCGGCRDSAREALKKHDRKDGV